MARDASLGLSWRTPAIRPPSCVSFKDNEGCRWYLKDACLGATRAPGEGRRGGHDGVPQGPEIIPWHPPSPPSLLGERPSVLEPIQLGGGSCSNKGMTSVYDTYDWARILHPDRRGVGTTSRPTLSPEGLAKSFHLLKLLCRDLTLTLRSYFFHFSRVGRCPLAIMPMRAFILVRKCQKLTEHLLIFFFFFFSQGVCPNSVYKLESST